MFKPGLVASDGSRMLDLRLAAVAVLIAFCLTAAGSYWNVLALRAASLQIARTHDALMATHRILSVLQDAETGQRGFLISNDPQYLAPYASARASVERELRALGALGEERLLDPAQVQTVARLAADKFDELESVLAAHERAGPAAARALLNQDRGKVLMDELRLQIAAMERGAEDLRRERIEFRKRAVRIALWSTTAFVALGLLAGGMLASLIARQRATQRALHEERGRLRATLLSIGDGVIVTDAHGIVTTMNVVAETLTGWADGSSIGHPLEEVFVIVNQQTREPVANPALRALREGKIFGLANHTVLLTPDGRETPIDDSAAPIQGAHGAPVGAVLVFRDVSERYAAEQALQASEMRLRRVIDSMFAFVGIVDLDGRLREANRAPLEASGLRREEVVGKLFWECAWWDYDPAVQVRLREAFLRALKGESVRYDETIRTADDGRTVIDLMLQPVAVDGHVSFVIPSAVDIAGRKELERGLNLAVAEAERRATEAEQGRRLLEALMEYIPEGVTIADAAGDIRLVSRHGLRMVQHPLSGLTVGLEAQAAAWSILHAQRGECALTDELPLARAIRRGEEVINEEWILRVADGRLVPVLCNAGPIRDAAGRIAGGVVVWRDVTEMKRIEENLRDADRRKDEFLATLAHELRNPLAPVRNGLEILRIKPGEDSAPVLEMITRQVNHMVRLIDDLLDISRITTGKIVLQRKPFRVDDAVQAAVDAVQGAVESAGHALTIDAGEVPLWIDGDPVRIAQIVSNLLTNAVRYTPHGGRIRLQVRVATGCAEISVSDNGIGIPAPMLDSVFEMFSQVDGDRAQPQQGLGIGLALVKRLVELHGGTVVADSAGEGRGATLTVRLPLVEAVAVADTPDTPDTHGMPTNGDTASLPVLIVDDNADSAESLAALIEMTGHRTAVAHDGPAALALAEAFNPRVVLLDIGLPGLDGYDVARLLRAHPRLCTAFLVAVTGWGTEADVSMAHAAGFDVHLTKPIEYDQLLAVFARAEGVTSTPA